MNGVKPGDRVWIFRVSRPFGLPAYKGDFRNIGKTLHVIGAVPSNRALLHPDIYWWCEALEPVYEGSTGITWPAGTQVAVLRCDVKPLRDPDAHEDTIELIKELTNEPPLATPLR